MKGSDNDFVTAVIEAMSHPFYAIDADTFVVRMVNSAGVKGELSEGCTCYMLTHHRCEPCDLFGVACPLAEIKRLLRPATVEHVHYDADGQCRVFEVHAFPILNAAGRLTGIIEHTLDISERKQAERVHPRMRPSRRRATAESRVPNRKGEDILSRESVRVVCRLIVA